MTRSGAFGWGIPTHDCVNACGRIAGESRPYAELIVDADAVRPFYDHCLKLPAGCTTDHRQICRDGWPESGEAPGLTQAVWRTILVHRMHSNSCRKKKYNYMILWIINNFSGTPLFFGRHLWNPRQRDVAKNAEIKAPAQCDFFATSRGLIRDFLGYFLSRDAPEHKILPALPLGGAGRKSSVRSSKKAHE